MTEQELVIAVCATVVAVMFALLFGVLIAAAIDPTLFQRAAR